MKMTNFINGLNSDISFTKEERKKIIIESVKQIHWKQKCIIAMEEFSELIKQLSKQMRFFRNRKQILEEMADAYICLENLKVIFHFTDIDINKAVDVKLDRERKRLKNSICLGEPINLKREEQK